MKKNKKGFTIIEVSIAGFLMATLGVALLGLQYTFSQNEATAFNTYQNVNEANSIVSGFSAEIRKANQSENGSFAFVSLDDYQIIFYSDYDYDSVVERVRYTLNGNVLEKGVIEPAGTPAEYLEANESVKIVSENVINATTPMFFYYNQDWPEDTTNNPLPAANRIADTKLVKIYLSVNNQTNRSREDYTLESFVQPRNLKTNL